MLKGVPPPGAAPLANPVRPCRAGCVPQWDRVVRLAKNWLDSAYRDAPAPGAPPARARFSSRSFARISSSSRSGSQP